MNRFGFRLRFTALYSGLVLATSAILLVSMNVLLEDNLQRRMAGLPGAIAIANLASGQQGPAAPPNYQDPNLAERVEPPPGANSQMLAALEDLPHSLLVYQWTAASILIAVLTVISIAIGWWFAGRLLGPVRRITEAARRLSLSNLHERIAFNGPKDELAELADTFDGMLDRLETSVNNQRLFIANAAHELRTPLAIQRAAVQIGLESPTAERLAQVREDLLAVNRRSELLIDGLLWLAQADHGLDAPEPVALDTLVRQAVTETPVPDGMAMHHSIQPVVVNGNPVLLHMLAANLIHNAIRYNRADGYVEIELTATGTLLVRNSGPEIPADRIEALFEPFRRLHTERTGSSESAGLGLSIVASIARAHGAAISARPNRDGGLLLTVQFQTVLTENIPGRLVGPSPRSGHLLS